MNESDFCQRLLMIMKQKKISQIKVSKALGLSRTAVNKWTKGGMIDDGNLERLARFLDVDMIWLKYGQQTDNANQIQGRNINEVHIQDSAEIVTWEWNLLTDTLIYSDNVEQVYGVKITSNQDYWGLMSDESRETLNRDYEKIIREGGAHEMDFKITKDGEYRWITSRATGVRGPNGKITRLVGISLDNTERKNAELQLRSRNNFFKTLLSHIGKLVVFADLAGEILATNLDDQELDVSYLELQTLMYNLILKNGKTLIKTEQDGFCELLFEGRKVAIYYHLDDDNKQPFLMVHID